MDESVITATFLIILVCVNGCKVYKAGDDGIDDTLTKLQQQKFKRTEIIEKECEKYDKSIKLRDRRDAVPNLIVDNKHKVVFCAIPKVASSNWKHVFIDALNITSFKTSPIRSVHESKLLPNLRDFNEEDQNYILQNYFKFVFVRHPFERLLSAYRNKLENRAIEWLNARNSDTNEVIMRVKEKEDNRNARDKDTLSFQDFITVLTSPEYRISHFNTHWKQFHKLCHPCVVRYDFIGKMETFEEDLDFVRKKTGLWLGEWFKTTNRITTPPVMKRYYESLSTNTLAKLYDMYRVDMKLFNYTGKYI